MPARKSKVNVNRSRDVHLQNADKHNRIIYLNSTKAPHIV